MCQLANSETRSFLILYHAKSQQKEKVWNPTPAVHLGIDVVNKLEHCLQTHT